MRLLHGWVFVVLLTALGGGNAFLSTFKSPTLVRLDAIAPASVSATDGLKIHVLISGQSTPSGAAKKPTLKPPLLFIHGSFHSADCFGDNFLPYFEEKGWDVAACSLRGTGPTGMLQGDQSKSIPIDRHVDDVKRVLGSFNAPPIIVAHSFGGLVTMKLLEDATVRENVHGVVTMCSVPPTGNGPMTGRFVQRGDYWKALQITRGFVLKEVRKNAKLCRELFFDERVSDADIAMYMQRFAADSEIGNDLGSLRGNLPSDVSMCKNNSGLASYLKGGDKYGDDIETTPSLRRLVVGAAGDYIVDREGVCETGRYVLYSSVLFLSFLVCDVSLSLSLSSIYCCVLAFSDMT
jgi:pimeloyl-ACP methyl ester carboxylesterase